MWLLLSIALQFDQIAMIEVPVLRLHRSTDGVIGFPSRLLFFPLLYCTTHFYFILLFLARKDDPRVLLRHDLWLNTICTHIWGLINPWLSWNVVTRLNLCRHNGGCGIIMVLAFFRKSFINRLCVPLELLRLKSVCISSLVDNLHISV